MRGFVELQKRVITPALGVKSEKGCVKLPRGSFRLSYIMDGFRFRKKTVEKNLSFVTVFDFSKCKTETERSKQALYRISFTWRAAAVETSTSSVESMVHKKTRKKKEKRFELQA